jgi:membrane associated rhomboid family serine protease
MQEYNSTYSIFSINIFIFFVVNLFLWPYREQIMYTWGFLPTNSIFTLVTYSFLHGGLSHIFFNMVGLICYGRIVEKEVGSKSMLQLYLFATVMPMILQHWFLPSNFPTIGASAAIFGLTGAALLIDKAPLMFRVLGFLLIFKEFYTLFSYNFVSDNVAHFAHVFGFLAGFLWMLFKSDQI